MSTGVNTVVTIISSILTFISICVTIFFGIEMHNAKVELNKMRKYLDFKKMEDFSKDYREVLKSYCTQIERPKWREIIQGKDIVGPIDGILTEFNTHLPKMGFDNRRKLVETIDGAKKEFVKVRKGDETIRDINLQHLNTIDRILNEEIESQRNNFIDIL